METVGHIYMLVSGAPEISLTHVRDVALGKLSIITTQSEVADFLITLAFKLL